jgi:putative addiction module component (TIGR02574 family)
MSSTVSPLRDAAVKREAMTILDAALRFPPEVRAEIAERLVMSLDDQYYDKVNDLWMAEIEKRMKDVDEGRVETIPLEEAMRMAKARQKP